MSNRRRLIIILSSVLVGTFLAALLMSKRYGGLSPQSVQQLFINFLFALAIVVGIAILLQRSDKKNEEKNGSDNPPNT